MIEPQTLDEPTISEDTALNIKSVNKLSGQLEQIKNATEATEQEPVLVPVDMTEIALSKESEESITTNILAVHLDDEMEKIKDDLEKTFNELRNSGEVNALLELANLEHPTDKTEVLELLEQDYPAFGLIYDEVMREKKELGPELEVMRYFIAKVNASQHDEYLLDATGVEFSDLKSAKQVCDKINEKMEGLSKGTDTDTDAAIASINELITQARVPKKGEDSAFKKLYSAWHKGIRAEIKANEEQRISETRQRRQDARKAAEQRLKDDAKAKEDAVKAEEDAAKAKVYAAKAAEDAAAAAVVAAKNAEDKERLYRKLENLQMKERAEKLKRLERVKYVNSIVISKLDKAPVGQLPDLKIKLETLPYIDELDPKYPPDMTHEEALVGELKRLTLVMLEYTEKNEEATKKYKDIIKLPFNHALRQIIDIYKGTISKYDLIEAIKSSVMPQKFSEGTIERIVTGMIAEVAVQDVARKEYGEDYVRDSTTEEDSKGSDFFVKVKVIDKYGIRKDLEFGLDVKTGRQQAPKGQKNNEVVIKTSHIDSDTFSVWPENVESVKYSIASAIKAKSPIGTDIEPLKDSGKAAA